MLSITRAGVCAVAQGLAMLLQLTSKAAPQRRQAVTLWGAWARVVGLQGVSIGFKRVNFCGFEGGNILGR
jgi:hypothetical protein